MACVTFLLSRDAKLSRLRLGSNVRVGCVIEDVLFLGAGESVLVLEGPHRRSGGAWRGRSRLRVKMRPAWLPDSSPDVVSDIVFGLVWVQASRCWC